MAIKKGILRKLFGKLAVRKIYQKLIAIDASMMECIFSKIIRKVLDDAMFGYGVKTSYSGPDPGANNSRQMYVEKC